MRTGTSCRLPDLPFSARNCFCDRLCRVYGDCCRDADRTSGSTVQELPALSRGVFVCERIEEVNSGFEIYLVNRCPKSYKDTFVRNRCEDEQLHDMFYRILVSGSSSQILYRNVYCAICNDDNDVVFWHVIRSCSPGSYDPSNFSGNIDTAEKFNRQMEVVRRRCPLEIAAPAQIRSGSGAPDRLQVAPRKCKWHVSRCDGKWKNEKVAKLCRQPANTAYVYYKLQVYKNKHCAICNFLNESDFQCEDARTLFYTDELDEEVIDTGDYADPRNDGVRVIVDLNTGKWNCARDWHIR